MNVLSSILKFLGDTLGDDPSTLTTTNKTLVDAINEVNAGVSAVDSKIHISTSAPTSGDGNNGDIWLVYEE